MVRLGDVCDVRDGTHDSPQYVNDGYPLVTSKNIMDGDIDFTDVNYISEVDFHKINQRSKVDDGDIIMPMIGTIGKPVIVNTNTFFAIKNVALIKFIENKVSNIFIKYLLDSSIFANYVEHENRGGTQKFLSLGNIRKFSFPLPPLGEQKRIAKALDLASEIVKGYKEQLAGLDKLVQSVFYEMFGDPVTNEKGWEICSIKNIVRSAVSNGFFAKRDDYTPIGNVAILGVANIVNCMYSRIHNLPKTNATPLEIDKFSVSYGDLLFCRSSLVAEGIGKASIAPPNTPKGILFECHVIRAPIDMSICVPEFIQVQTTTNYFRNQIISQSKTSTMTTIGQSGILKSNVILPPLPLQTRFASIVTAIEAQKAQVQKAITEAENLFNSLMQEYFE